MSEHDQVEDMDFMAGIMEARELIDDADQGDRATVDDLISRNNGGWSLDFCFWNLTAPQRTCSGQ